MMPSFHLEHCDSPILHRNKYWHFFNLAVIVVCKKNHIAEIEKIVACFCARFPLHLILCRHFAIVNAYFWFACHKRLKIFIFIYFAFAFAIQFLQMLNADGMRFIKAIIFLLETDLKCWHFRFIWSQAPFIIARYNFQ